MSLEFEFLIDLRLHNFSLEAANFQRCEPGE
jgi:hypothetical protein